MLISYACGPLSSSTLSFENQLTTLPPNTHTYHVSRAGEFNFHLSLQKGKDAGRNLFRNVEGSGDAAGTDRNWGAHPIHPSREGATPVNFHHFRTSALISFFTGFSAVITSTGTSCRDVSSNPDKGEKNFWLTWIPPYLMTILR